MKTRSKYLVFALIIFGSCFGMAVLTPQFNLSQDTGILAGMALGGLVALLIPNLRKALFETVEIEHQEVIAEKRYINFKEVLTHPTYLPMTIGSVWLIIYITIVLIFNLDITQKFMPILSFVPVLISIGLSGLVMIKRQEMITGGWFGYIVKKTKWAIVLGIVGVVIGFGGSIFFIMASIFNW